MIYSQWHPLANPEIDCADMNIIRVGYTSLGTDLPFCQLCSYSTAVHENKWLAIASTKKAWRSLTQRSLPNLLLTGSNCHLEARSYISNITRKHLKLSISSSIHLLPQYLGDIARWVVKKWLYQKTEDREV